MKPPGEGHYLTSGPESRGLQRQTVFVVLLALMAITLGGRQLMMTREYAADGLETTGLVISSRQLRRWPQEHWSRIYFRDGWGQEYVKGLSHGGPALAQGKIVKLKYLPRSPGATAILAKTSPANGWAWVMVISGAAGLAFFFGWRRPNSKSGRPSG